MAATFSDDTTSGRWARALRGSRRVTILARAEDTADFDWLAAIKHEFFKTQREIKSSEILRVMDAQPRAAALIWRNVENYSIFVVDLYEYRRTVLGGVVARLQPIIPPGVDAYEFVLELPQLGSKARALLREFAVSDSVVGRLERFLSWASNPIASEFEKEGLGEFGGQVVVELMDRRGVESFHDGQLALLLARVGAAIGDAISPNRQEATIRAAFHEGRFLAGGYIAANVIGVELGTDRIYDVGPQPVRLELEAVHRRLHEFAERSIWNRFADRVKRGILEERVSDNELGLQAADIAAALAAREYETAALDESEGARARAVQRRFAMVLLNGKWL